MSDVKVDYETWMLIADGEKALFLKNLGDAELPNFEVQRVEEHENPSDQEQSANRPGRLSDGGPNHRSAVEDTDFHQLEKERFAAERSDILYKMAHKKRFERIVLVAPAKTLGELRDRLHKEVKDRVVGEISKDLTNHPIDQIEKALVA